MVALLSVFASGALPRAAVAQSSPARSDVFVLSTLWRRHATTPAYSYDTLRQVIERISPEVVVLDVTPGELREQSVSPGKAEYTQVIFPLVRERGYRAYAGEPDDPDYTTIVQRAGKALTAFRTEQPEVAQAFKAYDEAAFGALAHLWRTPADVNGALTDQLLAARQKYLDHAAGSALAADQRLWIGHIAGMVRRAAAENPGKRVLVLIGVENGHSVRAALREIPELRLVNTEEWLRGTGPRSD